MVVLIGIAAFLAIPSMTYIAISGSPARWVRSARARSLALILLGVALSGGFFVPLLFGDRLSPPLTVACVATGGCLALAATTYLVVTAAPPHWTRSFRARLVALGLFLLGMILGVAVPLLYGK